MKTAFALFVFLLTLALPSWGATVEKIDGQIYTLALTGEAFEQGKFYSTSKSKVHVRVLSANKETARVQLMKGRLTQGERISFRKQPVSYTEKPKQKRLIGVSLGANSGRAEITFDDGSKKNLSGTGASLGVHFEQQLSSRVTAFAQLGVEQFKTGGGSFLPCDGACEIEIDYLFSQMQVRWNLRSNSWRYWGGGGAGYYYPLARRTTAVRYSSIKPSFVPMASLGIGKALKPQTEWTLQLSYLRFPSEAQAKTSILGLQLGHGWHF